MNRICYLLYQNWLKLMRQRKRYALYVLSFYIGLLLPAFCIANIRSVNRVIKYTTFENMESSLQMDWFSKKFDLLKSEKEYIYSISACCEEEFEQWESEYVSIKGIDENYCYSIPEIDGRSFLKEEYQSGSPVCLIGKELATEHGCEPGNEIIISGMKCKVIGIMRDDIYPGIILPYQTMRKIYEGENIQFTGIFFSETDGEIAIQNIINEIKSADKNVEILEITDGQTLYNNAMLTKTKWRAIRGTVALIALVFFILNELIVFAGKMEKERNVIGINRAVGASQLEIQAGLFVETLMITIAADLLVLGTIKPIGKCMGLAGALVVDKAMIIELFILSVAMCEILSYMTAGKLKTQDISEMLKTKEL